MTGIDVAKVTDRVIGRAAADEYMKMILEEAASLKQAHSVHASQGFLHSIRDSLAAMLPTPQLPVVRKRETPLARVLAHCDEIIGDIDKMPSDLEGFAESARAIVTGIRRTVQNNNEATERQKEALQNIHTGILKCIRK